MKVPKTPSNELQRLNAVRSYHILDTLPESDYDHITSMIAAICEVPISLISILDENRNFFKSHHGVKANESQRHSSFCGHTILEDDIFIIPDARKDERFSNNPLISEHQTIFYAGVPLINPEGFPLGTLCVFDHKPRVLSTIQKNALKTMAHQVMQLLELRKKNHFLEQARQELVTRNEQLKSFASHVSHDLKSPLANIISLSDLLRDEHSSVLAPEAVTYLDYIEESATVLKDYIDGILMYYKADELLKAKKEDVRLEELAENIKQILAPKNEVLQYDKATIKNINKSALSQILINLVDNALKYNDKPEPWVAIAYDSDLFFHKFEVSDNGMGIPKDQHQKIFEIFTTVNNDSGKTSTGIGLSTVKNLVEKLGGTISVASEKQRGSTFYFSIAK